MSDLTEYLRRGWRPLTDHDKRLHEAADRIERLDSLVTVLGSALTAVAHDRPSAHSDGVWLQIQQALETLALDGEKP